MKPPLYGTAEDLQAGDVIFVKYPWERLEIPENKLGRRDIEPVEIRALPNEKEHRFLVYSIWRKIEFYIDKKMFCEEDLMSTLRN